MFYQFIFIFCFQFFGGKFFIVVFFGKIGNGKSVIGNRIVGEFVFEEKVDVQLVIVECQCEKRVEEREINVIDILGVIDIFVVKKMSKGIWFLFFKKD